MNKKLSKNLTQTQKKKIEKIVNLFQELESQNVKPLILESGGCPRLVFFRSDENLTYELLMNIYKNDWNEYRTNILIDMIVP